MVRQCLLDESSEVAISLACPSCHRSILSTTVGPSATNPVLPRGPENPQILTRYINEGGVQDNLDILPLITEEAYLDGHPTARPARAFMTMCSEGDVGGIMELLESQGDDEDSMEEFMPPAEILRYQDPLNGMKSSLHIAIEKSQEEIVWLLLWLASSLDLSVFPKEVAHAAQGLGAGRGTAGAGADIRSLKDEEGHTAEDIAAGMGGFWNVLLQPGVLRG